MSWKLIRRVAVVLLFVAGAVPLWPNLQGILTLGAVFLFFWGVVAVNGWAERRRRRGAEASAEVRGTTPFQGGRGGSWGM